MARIAGTFMLMALLSAPPVLAAGNEIDVCDTFQLHAQEGWRIQVERYMPMRTADVRIDDRQAYPFSLMLYFKCDTPDLAQFDSPEKIERSVRTSSVKYLSGIVEKEIVVKRLPLPSTYGFYTVLTDAALAHKAELSPGEYRYLTRGMVRVSQNTALGFSLMTNDLTSAEYQKRLEYIFSFVKPRN